MTAIPALNEQRVVTVLSVDMVGSTRLVTGLTPQAAQLLLDESFARIRAAVAAAGGMVVTFNGDGALAVFGWPSASEQHAELALQAAWDIQSGLAPDEMVQSRLMRNVRYRIGIDSGLVAIRRVELDFGSRLDVIGDSVHIAAQLQKYAPEGMVLASRETVALCSSNLLLEPFDTSSVGTAMARKAFVLKARPTLAKADRLSGRFQGPLIGRDAELERIRVLASPDLPASLALLAEPGLGKSHLAAAASSLCSQAGRHIVLYEAQSTSRLSTYSATRRLLLANLGPKGKDLSDQIANLFYAAGGSPRDLDSVLQVLSSTRASQASSSAVITETRLAAILAAMLLHVLEQRPTLLLVEDIHDVDAESQFVFRLLINHPGRHGLSVLLTGRPEARECISAMKTDVLWLSPLDTDQARALIRSFRPDTQLPPKLENEIIRRAGGNPFVIGQLLQSIDETLTDPALPLPKSVESLIHARLDRLGDAERRLVQGLSLLGERIDVTLAERTLGTGARLGSAQLKALEDLSFIAPVSNGEIRFRHALVAAACASSVGPEMRTTVHLRAIHAIENLNEDLTSHHSRLAYHAREAGETQTALRYLWSAARRARRLTSAQTLRSIFDEAMAICEEIGEAAEIQFVDFVLLSFETFHLSGEIERIDPYLARAAEYAASQGRLKQVCVANCHQGISFWYRGRFAEGVEQMRSTLVQARFLGHLPLRFAAQFTLAQLLHNLAQIDEAYSLITELADQLKGDLELARLGALGLPASLAEAHAGYYVLETGRYQLAKAHCARALSIAQRGEDAYSEVLARIAFGRACLLTGHVEDAVGYLQPAQDLVEAYGFDPARPNTAGLLATALTRSGKVTSALELTTQRVPKALLSRTGTYERHYYYCGLGEALFVEGRSCEGLQHIDLAIATGEATSNPCILVQSLTLKAALLERMAPGSAETLYLRRKAEAIALRHRLAIPPDPVSVGREG